MNELDHIARSRSEHRGHPVAVVQIGDGDALVLDYDDASKPFPADTSAGEWSRVDKDGLWRGREAGRLSSEPEYPDAA